MLQEAWVRERDRICGSDAGCVADLDEKRIAAIEGDIRFRDQLADNDVDQAFGLLPDEAVAAASVFRLHHTLRATLGLAFALRLSGENSAEIADLLSGCGAYAITHGSRTALMYAAANASLPLIRLLVAAGADPSLADSKGNTALDYLEGRGPVSANLHLTAASLDEARALLTRH